MSNAKHQSTLMDKYVSCMTVEDGDDLIVSFGLGEYADTSLTLLRTPKYESLLPQDERGVSVGTAFADSTEKELLVSVRWGEGVVQIESTARCLTLDVRALDPEEIRQAKGVLRKMNFDMCFKAKGIERVSGPADQRTAGAMTEYNPETAPDPRSWLELDEEERISLAEKHHRLARIKLPNLKVHAVIHEIVENQIASECEPVVRAMERLMRQGLTRHEAVHAVGSVIAEHFFEVMKTQPNDDAATAQSRYDAAVERLTARSWRGGQT
jgi:hypothetical protein